MFGTAGSRRTVYVADDNNEVNLNSKPQSTPIKENPTYLVYNRISTVIGDGACQSIDRPADRSTSEPRPTSEDGLQEREVSRADRRPRTDKPDNSKESAIWYEYGCV